MDTQLHLRMKNIISHYENRIKELRTELNSETNPTAKFYLMGLIDGFQFMITAMRVDLIRFNDDPALESAPDKCNRHDKNMEELWQDQHACPECHYEAFHYADEGMQS